ncbi:hypothetical protein QQ045_024307 [Rhodiola kirilowii]
MEHYSVNSFSCDSQSHPQKEGKNTDDISHQSEEKAEEESGWTSYLDYYFKSSSTSETPSMLSDASSPSVAAWRSKAGSSNNKLQDCNKKSKAKRITDTSADEGLKDTASSPKKNTKK